MYLSRNKSMIAAIACAMACGTLAAQEAEFDLSSQRSEVQNVLPVTGKKLDHQGLIVNPMPHRMTVDRANVWNVSEGFALKDKQNKFANAFGFTTLDKKGVKLNVDFGGKAAAKAGVKEVSGAYMLRIDKKGVTIVGYDERGAFYGIQTLRQLLESPAVKDGELPYMDIKKTRKTKTIL